MVIHSLSLMRSINFCPSCPQTSFAICCGVEHWGWGVLHQVSLASGTCEGGGLLHDGHVEYDQGGVRVVSHQCPVVFISFGIPSLEVVSVFDGGPIDAMYLGCEFLLAKLHMTS